MVERFFRKAHVRRRLEEGPLAGVVRDYLGRLEEHGYSTVTIHQYVGAAEHFGRWLARSGRAVADADEAAVQKFVTHHLPRCRCRAAGARTSYCVRAGLRQLLAVIGVERGHQRSSGPIGAAIDDFDRHLKDACGAAVATRRYYLREAQALLATQFGDGPVDLRCVTSASSREFVTMRAKNLSPASTNVVVTAVRSFSRYLQLRGFATGAWATSLPRAADWRLARVPRVLTDEEVRALLGAFDRRRAQGRRDYAMTLCLLDLGLRASEVSGLTLADVDWRHATIALGAGKSRRCSILPVPDRVVRALANYVRRGRPKTLNRALFVHHRPPRGERVRTGGRP